MRNLNALARAGASGAGAAAAALMTGWTRVVLIGAALVTLSVFLGIRVHRAYLAHRTARCDERVTDQAVLSASGVADARERTDMLIQLVQARQAPPASDPPSVPGPGGDP